MRCVPRRRRAVPVGFCLVLTVSLAHPGCARAHGIAGNRYFPGTLTFDDPAVADELILPQLSASTHSVAPGDTVNETTFDGAFARLLTPDLAVGIDSSWTQWTRSGLPQERGWGTTMLSLKGRLYENDPHETLLSVTLGWGIPHSGSPAIGAGGPSTLEAAVFAGKGFGDLPDRLAWLRPFGVATGMVADFPNHKTSDVLDRDPLADRLQTVNAANPDMLHVGFALEYSTLYLTDRFDGQPPKEEPLKQFVPLVEFAFDTPLSAASGVKTQGTANPGLSYVAVTWQLAAEAIVPLDRAAGRGVGARLQLLFFLDDLVPALFAKPLLSERPIFQGLR